MPTGGLTGQVSRVVRHLLDGERRCGRVVAATRSAVYVETGDEAAPVLAVLSSDAVRVPVGVIVPVRSFEAAFCEVRPGSEVRFGAGALELGTRDRRRRNGTVTVTSGPVWVPPRPRVHSAATAVGRLAELESLVRRHARDLPDVLGGPMDALGLALRADDREAVERAAGRLLGLGPGLTPSGDDLLCGALVTGHALFGDPDVPGQPRGGLCGDPCGDLCGGIASAVETAPERTTTASAALLRCAAAGDAVPQLADLLVALGDGRDLIGPLAALLTVGHHSGSDLAHGVLLMLATASSTARATAGTYVLHGGTRRFATRT